DAKERIRRPVFHIFLLSSSHLRTQGFRSASPAMLTSSKLIMWRQTSCICPVTNPQYRTCKKNRDLEMQKIFNPKKIITQRHRWKTMLQILIQVAVLFQKKPGIILSQGLVMISAK